MKRKYIWAIAIVSLLIIAAIGFALFNKEVKVQNGGTVKSVNLNVFWERNCINEVTFIEWGSLAPNSSKTVTTYVKNTGELPISLSMYTEKWKPKKASEFLQLDWNSEGLSLRPGQVGAVNFTLKVFENATNQINFFNFTIVVVGTG